MKRLLALFLCIAYSVTAFCTVYASDNGAAAGKKDMFDGLIALMIDSNVCVVNGVTQSVGDVNPTIVQSRTLVPVRFLTESLGGEVEWYDTTRTAVLKVDGTKIDVPVGEDYIVVNGEKKQLDVGATLMNSRTMLPLRGICEAMGKEVSYDDGMILIAEKDFNDRVDHKDEEFRNQMLRYQLTEGKVLKPEPQKVTIKELAEKSECISVDSADLPYESAKDVCYLSRGGMNIVNMKGWMKDAHTFVLDFDVYNQRCSYGIVEVYDAEGNLKTVKFIQPYQDPMTTSLREWFENAIRDIPASFKAIYEYASGNTGYVDYKTEAQVTHVNIEAPKDGYMLFTASSAHSELVKKKNVIAAVAKTISNAFSLSGAYKDWKNPGEELLVEVSIMEDIEKLFAENPEEYLTIADIVLNAFNENKLSATGYKDSVEGIMETIYNAIEGSEMDIWGHAENVIATFAKQKGLKLTDDIKENLPIVGQAFKAMDVMATFFNTVYFLMDVNEAKYLSSVVFMFKDTPAIVSSNIMEYNGKRYTSGEEFPGLESIKTLMNQYVDSEYVIYNDKIYYSWVSDSKGSWDSKLYSCNLDGSGKKLLYEENEAGAENFVVSNKRVYLISSKKYVDLETGKIHDFAGYVGKNEILFYAKGNSVYGYQKAGKSRNINKTDVDTGEREVLATRGNKIDKCFETKEGEIYYLEIEWLEGAWLYQVKDGKSELVHTFNKEFESLENIIDGVIYYTGDTGNCVYLEYYDLKNKSGGRISQREYFAGGDSFYN